eukprot:IDg12959t1
MFSSQKNKAGNFLKLPKHSLLKPGGAAMHREVLCGSTTGELVTGQLNSSREARLAVTRDGTARIGCTG